MDLPLHLHLIIYFFIFPCSPHLHSHHPRPLTNSHLTQLLSLSFTMSKQLGQLLQEEQEPFVLETYLLERGCLGKRLTSEGGFSCCPGNSSKHLKGIPQCSKILRDIFDKLLSITITGNLKSKRCDHDGGVLSFAGVGSISRKVEEQDRFSSASSTTVFNSCSGSDTEDSSASFHHPFPAALQVLKQKKQREEEVQRRTKKHRRVSVLGGSSVGPQSRERTRKQQNSSTRKSGFSNNNRVVDDSVTSASLLELLVQTPPDKATRYREVKESQDLIWSNSPLQQSFKPKRDMVEKKKLLFDCVREVVLVEAHERRQQSSVAEFLGAEEQLKQLVCQKIKAWPWEKQPTNETSINHLLHLDFTASTQEWKGLERESRKIGLEIGEAILEDMINETVGY